MSVFGGSSCGTAEAVERAADMTGHHRARPDLVLGGEGGDQFIMICG